MGVVGNAARQKRPRKFRVSWPTGVPQKGSTKGLHKRVPQRGSTKEFHKGVPQRGSTRGFPKTAAVTLAVVNLIAVTFDEIVGSALASDVAAVISLIQLP